MLHNQQRDFHHRWNRKGQSDDGRRNPSPPNRKKQQRDGGNRGRSDPKAADKAMNGEGADKRSLKGKNGQSVHLPFPGEVKRNFDRKSEKLRKR
ncbi:hypothetical protein niasHT_018156 [Heterodera trifolii]|uniref:Uncharacterized protein n=1 Tax=Heterodera trifolii TaxID=157864 RepID=A0ABD2LJW1_9BILA